MNSAYTVNEITKIVEGNLLSSSNVDYSINTICFDTRKVVNASHSIFFALLGANRDGNNFIRKAIEAGIKTIVGNIDFTQEGINYIKVDHSLEALQKLTTHHRNLFSYPVIGITGSNGKTIVKEWLNNLMSPSKKVVKNPNSYNSQIGVPMSVWEMNEKHEIGIFEAGISLKEEMEKIAKIIQPTIGIFTNIGEAHKVNFSSKQEKANEKALLFRNAKKIIYCEDYTEITEALNHIGYKGEKIGWSFKNSGANTYVEKLTHKGEFTTIRVHQDSNVKSFNLPFSDVASLENVTHCIITVMELNFSYSEILTGLTRLQKLKMRLEQLSGIEECVIINDSYNADFEGFKIALDNLNGLPKDLTKTIILSDFAEISDADDLYPRIANLFSDKKIQRVVGIGNNIKQYKKHFKMSTAFFSNVDEFLQSNTSFQKAAILIKGSRKFGLEQIIDQLAEKTHNTIFEINLSAIRHNLNYFRSQLKPQTKLMAMVKAFAYGNGGAEIASFLANNRVDYLGVAFVDEGIGLRQHGVQLPIMVMNPKMEAFDQLIEHELEPELYNFKGIERFIQTLEKKGIDNPYPVHIKLETGMHRLGFEDGELSKLIMTTLQNKHKIQIASAFSHLATADEKDTEDFVHTQANRYKEMVKKIEHELGHPVIKHLVNSAGILNYPSYHFDMVRLGIGMYGLGVENNNLQPTGTLKTTISQIKTIKKGESVGYGRLKIADNTLRIATLPIGYADGLNRLLSNEVGSVIIKDKQAPIVGNICMDMCMVDVTEINCKEGDEVLVLGGAASITQMAKTLQTIPYEVLTSISPRVKRVFYQE